jgi:predicted dehydrogenase
MNMPPPIAVAVVGVGHLGRHHLRLSRTLPGWTSVGAYDPERARLEEVCREFGATPFASIDEAIERCAAVVVASPTVTHHEIATRFLAAGRHVMVEKPIAASIAEAEDLVSQARTRGVVLGVGHVEFYNPAVQAVLAREPRPRYLDAQRLSPFTRRSLDIDVILDLMVHDLQLAQALNRSSPVTEVRAVGVPVLSPKVDLANVRIQFASGCVATLTASRVSSDRVRKLRLFEPSAYYSIDYADQSVSAYQLRRDGGEPRIEPVPLEVVRTEPLAAEHWRSSERRGAAGPFVDGADGAATLATALAVTEAIAGA